jgi:transposase|tara:strand:- start:34 stop:1629 length:1596 start_codon:yes stop_codon:yes gene_type:complete
MARTDMPSSVNALQELVLEQRTALDTKQSMIDEQAALISFYREWKRLIDSQRFGSRSEKIPPEQGRLFNEAEIEALLSPEEGLGEERDDEIDVPAHTRKKRGRRPLPDSLPVQEILHDLPEEEKVCAHDPGHTLVEISRETSEQLKFIPARAEIVRHIRPKYACPACKEGVKIAPMPKLPIPKSIATPSLLAHVVTSKYVDGLPLYRQEKIFQRLGVDVSRATLASWMVKMGDLVEPLMDWIRDEIRRNSFVQCDETPFQVLKEPGKRAQSQSYLWVLRGGESEHPLIYYEYDPSRSSEVPKRLLCGFEGFLQTDGYEGYTAIGKEPGIVHVGCWAHTRRKFDEALRGQGKTKKKGSKKTAKQSKARQALSQIQALYVIERSLKDVSSEQRHAGRQERSKVVIEKLRHWLDASMDSVPPQSLTGKAMAYMHRQWPKLIRILDDGRIPLDTNWVENAIRPFAVGRKAWLFADTVAGARASANLYGLIETAKANRIEPWRYLAHLFEVLPEVTLADQVEALLPQNIDPTALRS